MKYCIVAVGVLVCFLATVQSYDFHKEISVLKERTSCTSGEECPPPSPCHTFFCLTKVCVFSAGIGKLMVDSDRRNEVIHSGFNALIRTLREMLIHSGEIIPGIGAMAIDFGFHTFNMVEAVITGLGKAVDWLGRPHTIKEYLFPVFVVPLQVLSSVFEGLDVAFDKSGYHELLKAWEEWIFETAHLLLRFLDAFFNHTPFGRHMKHMIENWTDWFRHHHDTSCRHYLPEQVCHGIELIMEGATKLFWGTITMWRNNILGVLHAIYDVLAVLTFPDLLNHMMELCYRSPIPNSVCDGLKGIIMKVHELATREARKSEQALEALRNWLNNHVFIDIEPLF